MIEGFLKRNFTNRWEVEGHEVIVDVPFEISLGGKWITGCLEYVQSDEDYLFFTDLEGHPIPLANGVFARIDG